ncbi:MAG: NADH-quinone oxidoreductase subunit C [Acidobacteria bacterium]|nr:NADH-quinone oxidoreductase subunit C [Acidobacteriota bacterium]
MLPENLQIDPAAITATHNTHNELTVELVPGKILDVLRALKAQKYERLVSVTAVDRYPMEPRFEAVYHLQSVALNQRIRLKCRLGGENPSIASATAVYASANWYERETFDLFGIHFEGHPNLTRIMMPEFWEGYPLRRDYPVHGHKYDYKNS